MTYIFILIIVASTGFTTTGYCFPALRNWQKTILCLPIGLCFYLVYLNIWIHLTSYLFGVFLALTTIIVQLLVVLKLSPSSRNVDAKSSFQNLSKGQAILLISVLTAQCGLISLHNKIYLSHDSHTHGMIYTQYSMYELSYPVDTMASIKGTEVPLNVLPKRALYHFGYDLMMASFSTLSGVSPQVGYFVMSTLSILLLSATLFLISYQSTSNFLLSLLVSLLLPFDGHIWPEVNNGFFRSIFPPLGTHIIYGINQGMVLVLCAMLFKFARSKMIYIFFLAALMVAQELVNESFLLTAGIAAFCYLFIYRRNNLPPFLLACCLALALIYYFGGVVGGILRGDSALTYVYPVGDLSQVRIRIRDFLHIDPFYGQAFPVYAPKHLLANFSIPLSYLAFLLLVYKTRRNIHKIPYAVWILFLISTIGLLIPGLIDFGYPQNVDAIRFVTQSSWAVAPFGLISTYLLLAPVAVSFFQGRSSNLRINLLSFSLWFLFIASCPNSGSTIKSLYYGGFVENYQKMKHLVLANNSTGFSGARSNLLNTSQANYEAIVYKSRQQQLNRNKFIPNYQVHYESPPILKADAGNDLVLYETPKKGHANLTLDGSNSKISDGKISSYIWKIDNEPLGEGSPFNTTIPIGTWHIDLTVKNRFNNIAKDKKVVSVISNPLPWVNQALAENGGIASSNGSHPGSKPENAIDGDFTPDQKYFWITEKENKKYFWQLALGPNTGAIKRIVLHFRLDYKQANQTNHISILGSNDTEFSTYETIATRQNAGYPPGGAWVINLEKDMHFKHIRLIKSKNTFTSIAEVQVWCEQQ